MRRLLLVLAVAALALFALCSPPSSRSDNKAALVVAMLKDVGATNSDGISWHVYADAASTTQWQRGRAEVRGGDTVVVETATWQLELAPNKVFGVSCHVTGGDHGYPEYGFITFLPQGGDIFDAMFSVGFDGRSIAAVTRICGKHGIPVDR